jgi:CRISPR-associated protein GSU0054/csb2, Dpsyc system
MPLVIDIELISGRYHAAGAGDRDAEEWPPHPARVFCALVASARSDSDRDALRWLEGLPAPVVQASPTSRPDVHTSYVVTNSVERAGGSQFHPGRTNARKVRHSAVPGNLRVRVVWTEVSAEPSTVALLDALARRVPYLGRSTGVAALSVGVGSAPESTDLPEGLDQFDPAPGVPGDVGLRVPYPGYLDLLIDQYDNARPAWEVSREVNYRRAGRETQRNPTLAIAPSVYTDVIILRFRGLRPDGRLTAMFTEALRRAVMSATVDPLPDALHGHGADGRPHVAFLGLPNAGNPQADGHLLGMAVAIPDLPEPERRAIVRGVLVGMRSAVGDPGSGQRTLHLNVPRIGDVDLVYEPGLVRPWGIRPERWRRGSDRWVSVTPVILDRYPRNGDVEQEIARSCVRVGLPDPADVVVSTAPLVAGGVRMRPGDLPEQARGKLFRHVELRFDRKVAGPILLGAGRYLGIGLLAPLDPSSAAAGVAS